MTGRRLLRLLALVAPLLAAPGCLTHMFAPSETQEDMDEQLDKLAIPEDFIEVERTKGEIQTTMNAPEPAYVTRTFAAPVKDRDLCVELAEMSRPFGQIEKDYSTVVNERHCSYRLQIEAGWSEVLSVWSYRLRIQATPREEVRRFVNDASCHAEWQEIEASGRVGGVTGGRSIPCWLPEGHALVKFTVTHE